MHPTVRTCELQRAERARNFPGRRPEIFPDLGVYSSCGEHFYKWKSLQKLWFLYFFVCGGLVYNFNLIIFCAVYYLINSNSVLPCFRFAPEFQGDLARVRWIDDMPKTRNTPFEDSTSRKVVRTYWTCLLWRKAYLWQQVAREIAKELHIIEEHNCVRWLPMICDGVYSGLIQEPLET